MKKYLTLAVLGFQTLFPAGVFALAAGEKAPPFRAQSTQGPVGIEDFRGKKNVVLAYYFRDFTSVWTIEMQAFQRDLEEFESLNAQVLGVSQDSVKTHEKFAKENSLSFPLIADEDGSIAKLYPGGRVTYVIDKEGIVRFVLKGLPENDILLRELKKLP